MQTIVSLKVRDSLFPVLLGVSGAFFLIDGVLNDTLHKSGAIGILLLLLFIVYLYKINIKKLENQKSLLLKEQLKEAYLAPGTVVNIGSYELGNVINPSGMKEQLYMAIVHEPFIVFEATVQLQISELRIKTIKVDMIFIRENSVATLYDYKNLPTAIRPFFSKNTGTICLVMK